MRVFVDGNMPKSLTQKLVENGHSIIKTIPHPNLNTSLSTHPDMQVRFLEEDEIVCDKLLYDYYSSLGIEKLYSSDSAISETYPEDVKLNFVVLKNTFIHKLSATDTFVLNYFETRGYEMIDVRQGYTKCNLLIGKNSLITSDTDIYKKLKSKFNILLISHGDIELSGYNYGFIGGTSGLVDGRLYLTGTLNEHKSGKKILDFLNESGEDVEFLSQNKISDYGSILAKY